MKPSTIAIVFSIGCLMIHSSLCFSHPDTLILQPGPSNGKDAMIRDDEPDTPYSTSFDFIANAWTADGFPFIQRSLIRFDLSAVPSGAQILRATMSLHCNLNTNHYQLNAGENMSYLLRINEDWNEKQVTWNNQPVASLENAVIIPKSYSETQNYPEIDVTDHVRSMHAEPSANYGWLFRLAIESQYSCMVFASSDNPMEEWRPALTVIYLDCAPPVAHFSYEIEDVKVNFFDSSSSATSWYWDFGDSYYSGLQNPTHAYDTQGKYYVCLEVADSCGSNKYCDTVYNCQSPNTFFNYDVLNHFVSFRDSSYQPLSWFWSFGDGFYSDLENPLHYFDEFGTYYVCLTTTNSCNQETFCDSVTVTTNGIDDLAGDRIVLYPNPAKDQVTLSLNNTGVDQKIILTLCDMQGCSLKQFEKTTDGINNQISIDISGMPCGVYYMKILMKKESVVKKFIKI